MFGIILNSLNIAITFVIPLIITFKSINSTALNIETVKSWLIYWLVYAGLLVIEDSFSFVLKFIPFYNFIRFYIHVWLILPQTQGSEFIYYNYLQPFMAGNVGKIDGYLKLVPGISLILRQAEVEVKGRKEDSFMDVIANKFTEYQSYGVNNVDPKSVGLVDSLLNVWNSNYKEFLKTEASTSSGSKPTPVTKSPSNLTQTDTNASDRSSNHTSDNDFDLVGGEDLVNFNEKSGSTGSNLDSRFKSDVNSSPNTASSPKSNPTPSSSSGNWFSGYFWNTQKSKAQ